MCSTAAVLVTALLAADPIVLDGDFTDWSGIAPVIVDAADAPQHEIDLGRIRATADERYIHFLVDIGATRNLQRLDGSLALVIDADGDAGTGNSQSGLEGAEYVVRFTAPGSRGGGMGAAIETPGESVSPYDLGVAIAPTYASRSVEVRLERGRQANGGLALGVGSSVRAQFVAYDESGKAMDSTDPFTLELPPYVAPSDPQAGADPLRKVGRRALRILSWNGERGALRQREEEATRVLKAIAPDVVLLQELGSSDTDAGIASLLQQATGHEYRVLVGAGGGNLHCAVATRLRVSPAPDIEPITDPQYNRPMRTAGFIVEHDRKRLLVVSVHLKCCGRIDDDADRRRLVQVDAIAAAIERTVANENLDGVIVAGDLNLVGARTPLERLTAGLDVDESELAVADAYQLDGRTNATWRDPRQPFLPGRLDFTLVSDSTLEIGQSFVFDTEDLAPRWLRQHGLRVTDTDISDHLPLITDVSWRRP